MLTWDEFCIYVLRYLSNGDTRTLTEIRAGVIDLAALPEDQRAELLPSGQRRADNRISWAASFLGRVEALERPSRGQYRITDKGRMLLAKYPGGISEVELRQYALPDDAWSLPHDRSSGLAPSGTDAAVAKQAISSTQPLDPIEQIEEGLAQIHDAVRAELLERLQDKDPAFFEQAVVQLLVAMGYGGADGTARVTQQTNDGGIDGVIDRDALGLDRVYVQAKRYARDNQVGRPEVQAFVGALSGKATTGVFLTTGRFSSGALEYVRTAHTRIILIDGTRLTDLMIRFGVGVQVRRTLHIVEIDEDFFE